MAQYMPEFNSANTEDRVQIESSSNSLKVYINGAWQTYTFGASNVGRGTAMYGTATPLKAETIGIQVCTNNATALTTGTVLSEAIYLPKGMIVNGLAWFSGTTALSGTSHATAGLYDTSATPAVIAAAQCADQASLTWAAYTMTEFVFAAAYKVPTSGVYYGSLTITGTVPTLMSTVAMPDLKMLTGAQYQTGAFDQVVRSGSAQAGVLPATITSTTVLTFTPWMGVF